jgi:hypothetical protein
MTNQRLPGDEVTHGLHTTENPGQSESAGLARAAGTVLCSWLSPDALVYFCVAVQPPQSMACPDISPFRSPVKDQT